MYPKRVRILMVVSGLFLPIQEAPFAQNPTPSHLIDGRAQAADLKSSLKQKVDTFSKQTKQRPGLAIVRIGDDPASAIYVASKIKQSKEIGIRCFEYALPASVTQENVLNVIQNINDDKEMHGVIVQLPLPDHLDKQEIIEAIDPSKDVDGLHPLNFGRLAQGDTSGLIPCTPLGVMHLLKSVGSDLRGKTVAMIGASNLVGKPLSFLLKEAGCTVTLLHSKSLDIQHHAQNADIVISAVGKQNLIQKQWVKPGAIVIDVGINRDPKTDQIHGDVHFDDVSLISSHITPVPGGVGPMTVAYLLSNTIKAFENTLEK